MAASPWTGFYKKSIEERQGAIKQCFPELDLCCLRSGGLESATANLMIENCIGTVNVPLGLGLNMTINHKEYAVPMATEESSVIAAVSGAGKLISQFGGFQATTTSNVMIAQVQLLDVDDVYDCERKIMNNKADIIREANRYCDSMVERGGGVIDVTARIVKARNPGRTGVTPTHRISEEYVVVHFHVDVCEAMGANKVNTIAEGVSSYLSALTGARPHLKILSNLCTERIARAQFRIPVKDLAYKGLSGEDVAQRILEAYWFALDDPYRAATHNKGIMNGVDSVALATGQDYRAIEAAAHAHVTVRRGFYGPLSSYRIETDFAEQQSRSEHDATDTESDPSTTPQSSETYLVGELELPLAVGTKGGSLYTHPTYRFALGMLGNPDAGVLAQVMVSVGLAQNFAALRALATEGIQRGHMSLHARNIAIAAGVAENLVPQVVQGMIDTHTFTTEAAKQIYARVLSSSAEQPIIPVHVHVEKKPVPHLQHCMSAPNLLHANLNTLVAHNHSHTHAQNHTHAPCPAAIPAVSPSATANPAAPSRPSLLPISPPRASSSTQSVSSPNCGPLKSFRDSSIDPQASSSSSSSSSQSSPQSPASSSRPPRVSIHTTAPSALTTLQSVQTSLSGVTTATVASHTKNAANAASKKVDDALACYLL